jgi:hypothetical protein
MPRIVFFVLALFVLWRVLSALGKRSASAGLGADSYSRFHPQQRRRRMNADEAPGFEAREELVKCVQCGTYVPMERALEGEVERDFRCRPCRLGTTTEGRREA